MGNEVLAEYRKKALTFLIVIIMVSATAAGVVFPLMKGAGLYPTVSWMLIGLFEIFIVAEDVISGVLIRKSRSKQFFSKNG